jgi:hypothetical protein
MKLRTLALISVAFFIGTIGGCLFRETYSKAYRNMVQDHMLGSTVYCLAGAAANGDTNGVMETLSKIWKECDYGSSNILDACISMREDVVGLQKPEHFKKMESEHIGAR